MQPLGLCRSRLQPHWPAFDRYTIPILRHRQDDFCTRLDDTLILAIISDFDLTHQYDEARTILDGLAQDAAVEEASVSNPAGLDPTDEPTTSDCTAGLSEWRDTTETSQATTDSARFLSDTSSNIDWAHFLSDKFAALDLPQDVNVTTLDEDGKVAELKLMFADLTEVDLKLTLKKVKGDFTKACEELLNLQYLEENGLRPKGIEGAFRDEHTVGYQSKSKTPFSFYRYSCFPLVWFPCHCFSMRAYHISHIHTFTQPPTPTPIVCFEFVPKNSLRIMTWVCSSFHVFV